MNNSNYLDQLTWLRGLAAIFVVISHCTRALENDYIHNIKINVPYLNVLDLGTFGVLLFFTLSGTTLYFSHIHSKTKSKLHTFYLKRFFRIWPAFAFSLIIYIAFTYLFKHYYIEPNGYWIEQQFLAPYTLFDFISYLTLSFNIIGQGGLFNNAYWSLPVEFQYYLIFPLIVLSLKVFKGFGPLLIAAVLYLIFKLDVSHFNSPMVFMLGFTFSLGVLIGYIYSKTSFRVVNTLTSNLIFFVFLIALTILSNNFHLIPSHIPVISNPWIVLGGAAILGVFIVLFCSISFPNDIHRGLCRYGEMSYSVYLFHNLFIATAVIIIIQFQVDSLMIKSLIVLSFGFILNTLFSSYSYQYIEKPSMALGKKFSNKISGNK